MADEKVIWTPTEKQAEFLSASEFEVLYGGAAGGGKTDGLLIDALGLQHDALTKRAYQAIILRRTFPDLKDIIDRSHEIYQEFAPTAKYDKDGHVWKFPSGARIELGFVQRDADRFRYRGRAFQYVGWEELTLWPTELPYIYFMSRIRTADPSIPLYVRATTNPDGPGHRWVKERWRITNAGTQTLFDVKLVDPETREEFVNTRRFIPARVGDNPHIGKEYRQNLLLLDDDSQKALLRGMWEAPQVRGAYYAKETDKVRAEGRLTRVPYQKGVPVDTFWDFGVGDSTSVWCNQTVAMQERFLACYENNNESLSHYVKWLLEQPYVYGTHYLPHDAGHRRLGKADIKSWEEVLRELLPGHQFVIVPRVADLNIGIQQTRDKFDNCWFDAEGCAEGFAALENYHKKWSEEQQVYTRHDHDWSSNYADAFRQFGQVKKSGPRKKPPTVPGFKPFDRAMGY